MTESDIKGALVYEQPLALTMFAEAGGDWQEGGSSVEERLAVGCVVRNRVQTVGRWPDTFAEVCLQRYQFSCWDPGTDPNHVRMLALAERLIRLDVTDPVLLETIFLAKGIIGGQIIDRTRGATSYYAPAAMRPAGSKPFWVYLNGHDGPEHEPAARIGSQIFYQGV